MRTTRATDAIRPVEIIDNIQPQASASLMIKLGNTQVICAVSVENSVPPFLRDSGQGWITAEYGMLPTSTNTRMKREAVKGRSGRTYEIQRLIGRSLRMMVDLKTLGEKTYRVDCDVINADGGTRTAAITGAALALHRAIRTEFDKGNLAKMPDILPIAAISAGVVAGQVLLDLEYSEDSNAEVDANFVMTGDGRWIEAQSTAEGQPFTPEAFTAISDLARKGINELLALWESV